MLVDIRRPHVHHLFVSWGAWTLQTLAPEIISKLGKRLACRFRNLLIILEGAGALRSQMRMRCCRWRRQVSWPGYLGCSCQVALGFSYVLLLIKSFSALRAVLPVLRFLKPRPRARGTLFAEEIVRRGPPTDFRFAHELAPDVDFAI